MMRLALALLAAVKRLVNKSSIMNIVLKPQLHILQMLLSGLQVLQEFRSGTTASVAPNAVCIHLAPYVS